MGKVYNPFKETWKDKFEIKCLGCASTDIHINIRNKFTKHNFKLSFHCRNCKKRGTLWRHDK